MNRFISLDQMLYVGLIILAFGGFFSAIIWPEVAGFYTAIMAASLAGVGVTVYIYYAKRFKKQLACPSGDECNEVVNSKYAKFFGISLEYLGFLYYAVILLGYGALLLVPGLQEAALLPGLFLLSTFSFFFSLYLLFVQGVILKRWCVWCMLSAAFSTLIFVLAFISFEAATGFLAQIDTFLLALKDLGFVLGAGGITTVVLLFLHCLEDEKISRKEADALQKVSELVWVGFVFVFISQLARYVAFTGDLVTSNVFVVEVISLVVALVFAAILKIMFSPFLDVLPFSEDNNEEPESPLIPVRNATLIVGSVTMTAWYFAFAVSYLPQMSVILLLVLFAVLLSLVTLINLLWQRA